MRVFSEALHYTYSLWAFAHIPLRGAWDIPPPDPFSSIIPLPNAFWIKNLSKGMAIADRSIIYRVGQLK